MDWYNGWSPAERRAGTPIQQQAVRTGEVARPTTCSICAITPARGAANGVWFHDEDYAAPLAAYHVCRVCHRVLHERFEQPAPWRALVARYASGTAWFERLSMDPASRYRPFGDTYPNGLPPA